MSELINHGEESGLRPIRFNTPEGEMKLDPARCLMRIFGPGYEYMDHLEYPTDDGRLLGIPTRRRATESLLELGYRMQFDMEPNDEDIEWFIDIEKQRFDKEAASFLPAE